MSHPDVSSSLNEQLERVAIKRKARAIAVAIHDLETDFRFSLSGDRWFHAASTIKVAVLLAVFRAADESRLRLDDSLHVRNRFFSAGDGSIFHVTPDRDATPELYHSIGRTARISSLAHAMISGSSNLATNLLLDFVGVEYARKVLRDAQVHSVELRRGVEDHAAHEQGINNEATANGLVTLLSAIRGDFLSNESKQEVIRILLEQRFNSMIPARLPAHAAVAQKTRLAPHFTLAELMLVDCREATLLLTQFPHYVPCAIVVLARFLEDFRREVDAPVFISANGGYRSPAHRIGGAKSIHAWGTAANIYRVGDSFLDDARAIEKYRAIAASLSPVVFARPFGRERGQTDDHLHIDLGFVSLTPRESTEAS